MDKSIEQSAVQPGTGFKGPDGPNNNGVLTTIETPSGDSKDALSKMIKQNLADPALQANQKDIQPKTPGIGSSPAREVVAKDTRVPDRPPVLPVKK